MKERETLEIDQTQPALLRRFVSGYSENRSLLYPRLLRIHAKAPNNKSYLAGNLSFRNAFGVSYVWGAHAAFGGRAQPSKILWAENISAKKF